MYTDVAQLLEKKIAFDTFVVGCVNFLREIACLSSFWARGWGEHSA